VGRFQQLKRIARWAVAGIFSVLIIAFLVITGPAWWNKWVTYPKLEKERAALREKTKTPERLIEQTDYQGVLHAHSYWSHDSRGIIEEILPAAQRAKLDFIFLSDHIRNKLDSFPRGYQGNYDGVIIEAGTESRNIMVTPMQSGVLDWNKEESQLIRDVVENGGLVAYVHSEEPHNWADSNYQAMEIYNIHTDLLDEESILPFILNVAINKKNYRHWAYRELYDDQSAILAHWDSLNETRQIVGIAAADAHNNQSFRARYIDNGMVEWVGPNAKTLEVTEPGWKERLLLDEPNIAGWAFKWEVDTYFHSFNYVNTHVFSDTLSRTAIKDNIVAGHVYISFESLAEARGFQFVAQDDLGQVNAIMGDSVAVDSVAMLQAVSPLPVRFELFKNGAMIDQIEDKYSYQYRPSSIGNYRIVARLKLRGDWVSWVMTNPIYIH